MSNLEALTFKDRPLTKIRVHSLAILSILNSFTRRSVKDSRVVGTLIGEIDKDGITVTDSFAVPFSEKADELYVEINQDYHKKMYAFHRKNNKKEVIVGWYSTTTAQGQLLIDNSSLIHDFYASECNDPIHLVVDSTLLLGDALQVRGFASKPLTIEDQVLARAFREVKVNILLNDAEASILYLLKKSSKKDAQSTTITTSLPSAAQRLDESLQQFINVLDTLQQFVDQVVENINNNKPVSAKQRELGVQISEALQSVQLSSLNTSNNTSQALHQIQALQTRYQDLVMLAYISSLAQTQAVVAEKVNELL